MLVQSMRYVTGSAAVVVRSFVKILPRKILNLRAARKFQIFLGSAFTNERTANAAEPVT